MVVWRVLGTQRQRRVSDLRRLLSATSLSSGSGQRFVPLCRNAGSSLRVFQSAGYVSAPDDPEGAVARKKSILGLDFLSKLFHRNQVSPAAVQEVEQEETESDPAQENGEMYAQEEGEIQAQEEGTYIVEEAESGIQEEVSSTLENGVEVSAVEMESVSELEEPGGEAMQESSSWEASAGEAMEGEALEAKAEEVLEASAEELLEAGAGETLQGTGEALEVGAGRSALESTVGEVAEKKSLEELSSSFQEFIKALPPIPAAAEAPAAATPVPAETTAKTVADKAVAKEAMTKEPAAESSTKKTAASTKSEKPDAAKVDKEEKPATSVTTSSATEKPKVSATSKVVPSKAVKKSATPAAAPVDGRAVVFEFLRSKMRETGDKPPPESSKAAASPKLSPRFDPSSSSAEKTNAAINMLLESVEKSGKSPSPAAPIFEALNAKPEVAQETTPATPPPSLRLSLSSCPAEPAPMDAKTLMVEMNSRITDGKNSEAIALFEEWRRTINPLTLECNKPDRTLYNLYMQAKLKEETKFEELQEVVTEMEESGLPRDLAGYNILIRALFRKKDSGTAEKLLERMEKEEPHAQPDADSYNLVVVLCAHDRKVLAATKYMKSMLDKGFEPSRTTINEVVLATARSHQTKLAVSLLKNLKSGKLPLPMMNTCAELLMAASEVDDAECARLALAAITERPMAKFGPKMVLDEGTMIGVLGTAARAGDSVLCNHAWDALAHHTQSIGKFPSVEAYIARIHALSLGGDTATAFRSVWELEVHHGRKQETDPEAFSPFTSLKSLASACSRGGAPALDAAYYKLEEAHTKKQGVALAAINCVIQGCANLWDSERAFQTFEAIENVFGLRPDIHSCNALLHALGRTRMTEDALKVYDYIKEAGFKADKWTYMLLTDAHVVNHDPKSALDVLQTMIEDHHRPFRQTTLKVWTRCKQQEDNDALERLQKMEEALNYRQSFFANARRKLLLDVIKGDRPVPPLGLDTR